MSQSELSILPSSGEGPESGIITPLPFTPGIPRPLHRIAEVRRSQNVSLATIARQFGIPVATARLQEHPESDMPLSRLYCWQHLLNVPVAELLLDPDDYPDNPIRRRGELIKVMKTARTIQEHAQESSLQILAQTLCDQLIAIMPELVHIHPWPSVGQSRDAKDIGQAAYRRFDTTTSRLFEQHD